MLFCRSVGEVTDIVEKEMYTFEDRNGDSLSLRPEGTAGCVRACLQHGLLRGSVQKLWYLGPMYRHERPQKGRYRQFHQFGVESFGDASPLVEAEHLLMVWRLFQQLAVADQVTLEINTLGSLDCRARYREALVAYFQANEDQLDEDGRRRLETNPLRLLDSKHPDMQVLIANAPALLDYLSDAARAHFDSLCGLLDELGVPYVINPRIVRGLDYYCHTVYEWTTQALGAQGTICAGGRYDGLVEQLGGQPSPAMGFALGLERLVLLLQSPSSAESSPHVYVVIASATGAAYAMRAAEELRVAFSGMCVDVNTQGGSMKAQMKRANKSGAQYAMIIGDAEVENNTVAVKSLRETEGQLSLTLSEWIEQLRSKHGSEFK